jgi:hypothetical protein
MTRSKRVALYTQVCLVLACFAIIGSVIAEPLLRPLWAQKMIVAHR